MMKEFWLQETELLKKQIRKSLSENLLFLIIYKFLNQKRFLYRGNKQWVIFK